MIQTMGITALEISHDERENRPLFSGALYSREALQTYARLRWPANTAKHAAREWDLSLDEARGICAARSSQSVLDKILKHRNGGWSVALSVLGAVIGQELHEHIAEEKAKTAQRRREFEEHEQRLEEMAERARALVGLRLGDASEPGARASGLLGEQARAMGAGEDRAAVAADHPHP